MPMLAIAHLRSSSNTYAAIPSVQWSSSYNQRCHHFGDMAATTSRSVVKLLHLQSGGLVWLEPGVRWIAA